MFIINKKRSDTNLYNFPTVALPTSGIWVYSQPNLYDYGTPPRI